MYVCMYVCMYIKTLSLCMYVCTYSMYTYLAWLLYKSTAISLSQSALIQVYVCMYVCMYVYMVNAHV